MNTETVAQADTTSCNNAARFLVLCFRAPWGKKTIILCSHLCIYESFSLLWTSVPLWFIRWQSFPSTFTVCCRLIVYTETCNSSDAQVAIQSGAVCSDQPLQTKPHVITSNWDKDDNNTGQDVGESPKQVHRHRFDPHHPDIHPISHSASFQ